MIARNELRKYVDSREFEQRVIRLIGAPIRRIDEIFKPSDLRSKICKVEGNNGNIILVKILSKEQPDMFGLSERREEQIAMEHALHEMNLPYARKCLYIDERPSCGLKAYFLEWYPNTLEGILLDGNLSKQEKSEIVKNVIDTYIQFVDELNKNTLPIDLPEITEVELRLDSSDAVKKLCMVLYLHERKRQKTELQALDLLFQRLEREGYPKATEFEEEGFPSLFGTAEEKLKVHLIPIPNHVLVDREGKRISICDLSKIYYAPIELGLAQLFYYPTFTYVFNFDEIDKFIDYAYEVYCEIIRGPASKGAGIQKHNFRTRVHTAGTYATLRNITYIVSIMKLILDREGDPTYETYMKKLKELQKRHKIYKPENFLEECRKNVLVRVKSKNIKTFVNRRLYELIALSKENGKNQSYQ